MTEPAQTIDEIIERLTAIVEKSKQENYTMGYFPVLLSAKSLCR